MDQIFSQSGPSSVVGTANGYGLDGPGIESRWGTRFYAPVQIGPGAHLASMGTRSLTWGLKWPGHVVDHPPQSSAEFEERVKLYLYFPSETSWPVVRYTLTASQNYRDSYQSIYSIELCGL